MTQPSPPQPQPDPGPRRPLGLLVDPVFAPYLAGKVLSTVGNWIHNIVAAILAYELSGSALVVGMVSVAQFGPQLVLAPLSGSLADRGDRRAQLVVGVLIAASGSGGLGVTLLLLGPEGLPGAWPVILAALVVGIGFVTFAPAGHALLPSLVRHNELASAITLNSIPPTLARAAGPAAGALVAVAAGPATAFIIAAAANLLFALILVSLRIPSLTKRTEGVDRRIRFGIRYLAVDRAIPLLLLGVTAIGVGADPVITLTPPLAASFGEGSRLVGAFASAFGVGAAIAFLAISGLNHRFGLAKAGTGGLLLLVFGMAAAGLSPTPRLVIVALGIAGIGMSVALVSLTTQLQERLPDGLRGRIMSLWSIAFLGSRPLAAAMDGAVSDFAGPSVAFTLVAVLVGIAAWFCRPSSVARRPAPPPTHAHNPDQNP